MDEELTFDLVLYLGIGAVILIAVYYVRKLLISANPLSQCATCTISNAATGQLTQAQVDKAVKNEADAIVVASGGSISQKDAEAQARADQDALHKLQTESCCYLGWVGPWAIFF